MPAFPLGWGPGSAAVLLPFPAQPQRRRKPDSKTAGAELSSRAEQTSLPKGLEDHLHAQSDPPCLNQTILTSL